MKKLLSLPPNLVDCFHDIERKSHDEWFCTSDPIGAKLGSGGGTTWLLQACHQAWGETGEDLPCWLAKDKRILLHAGGQSRRLPGYAPSGKVLTPIPVFRWSEGQRLGQNLLDLQIPLYEEIMEKAPASLHTLIASGDVYIRAGKLQDIPEADVVCYGLWVDPSLAKNHGVFVSSRHTPGVLECMLQKPSVETLGALSQTHLYLMDIGIWLLSDRAVNLLMQRSLNADGSIRNYDLYSEFGCSLGTNPGIKDEELNGLSVAILPLPEGQFYHYGTSREMISSTLAIQNLEHDQRRLMPLKHKPHPAIFVQNAEFDIKFTEQNAEVWIENSYLGNRWTLSDHNIITGVPENDWCLHVPSGVCLDVVPMGDAEDYALRPYGFNDAFRGDLADPKTLFLARPFCQWAEERGVALEELEITKDLQAARLFPVLGDKQQMETVLRWMISEPALAEGLRLWRQARRLSADEISAYANLRRLVAQREALRALNWSALAGNYRKSVFYRVNLGDAAEEFVRGDIAMPQPVDDGADLMTQIRDHMFRSQVKRLKGEDYKEDEDRSFALLRDSLIKEYTAQKQHPVLDVYPDQIVWGRSPVRIDLAGGWTDTPPYCLTKGGNVVNLAIELNGQKPLQTYVKRCDEYKIILRSIDLGAIEVVSTYEELAAYNKVGSPFSIPKAALTLAGFMPGYCTEHYLSLEQQLKAFGSGIEVTLLSAIPAGSGLGTSSILASTVLAAIANFCGLAWDKNEICMKTLVLEQLLTTGGGWQDQFGGVLHGVKLLQTSMGINQSPTVHWLPTDLFEQPEYRPCHLLYYTGITRVAKNILAEIVRGMFLNNTQHLQLLEQMKQHALDMHDVLQRGNFQAYASLVGKTWQQNQRLDGGTNPPAVQAIIDKVKDYCLGYKLPGAGGGGYLYMIAKDAEAASRIKAILTACPPNERARFVDMSLSGTGLQLSRS